MDSKMHRFILLLLLSSSVSFATPADVLSSERTIHIRNDGSNLVKLFWVDPDTSEEVIMLTGLSPGVDVRVDTNVGHRFSAKEFPLRSGACENEGYVCREVYFNISDIDDQTIRITKNFTVEDIGKLIEGNEVSQLLDTCQARAKDIISTDERNETNAVMNNLIDCVETGLARVLEEGNDEITFHASVRQGIAAWLEKYTCGDDSLSSTEDVAMDTWFYGGTFRDVHIKHDCPASKIHVIENFISDEECSAMLDETERIGLGKAEVFDEKRGLIVVENRRKAKVAAVSVDWSKEKDGDPIARLSRRVYEYTNHVLGLNIQEHGQNTLKSIQYTGRGMNDTDPDKFTPHCDTVCRGRPVWLGQQVATMIMYCAIADRGGHTNFGNAGVHINPKKGEALFFSYIDPVTRRMDTGFTQHSGCPVYEGNKKIIVQWMRLGVDRDNPFYSFNALGIKLSDEEVAEARKNPILTH